MRTLAITVNEFAKNARRIVGADADVLPAGGVLIWPPAARYDMVLLFLHPRADGLAWVDDAGRDVLTVEDVRQLPLTDSIVFVGACYGSENRTLLDALHEAGARAIIHGPGVNYGGRDGVLAGGDILAGGLVNGLRMGLPLRLAWSISRLMVWVAWLCRISGSQDALEYVLDDGGATKTPWWKAAFTGFIALLFLLVAILGGGGGDGGLLTTFSSIPLPTPVPTWTPWYTPIPWDETPYPTATPCAGIGCVPYDDLPGIEYYIWLPLVMQDYDAGMPAPIP